MGNGERSETEEFLRAGVGNYGRACETIYLFREEMQERLRTILRERTWVSFDPHKKAIGGKHGKGEGQGIWIASWISGRLRHHEKVEIAIGIWWSPMKIQHDIILFACFREPEPLETHPFVSKTAGVIGTREKVGWYTRLYVPISADFDLDHDFSTLLTELERHGDDTCGCIP